ncbi:MAG: hypothetical protein B1H08_01200 [Candidatus Omnitrophica bacterium 4484_171]|nr:MAG: hypothetical protein B1H08_01200 [Candidatus Omnitrophica bacterium 4484_171]
MFHDYADLHIHSIYSDSSLSLENVFQEAKNAGLKCISLTDHDTIRGIKDARMISVSYGIELISGIEFSAQHGDREVHILGYMIDDDSKKINDVVSELKMVRMDRIRKMSLKLSSLGLKIEKDDLDNIIKDAVPTRLHLALCMVKKGYSNSIRDAFKKYLSYGKPAYVSRFRYSVKESIGILKKSKGVVFLAHPHLLPIKEWIHDFVDWGIDGIEVMYPGYSPEVTDKFSKIASRYNLLKSGGSDSHGIYKDFTAIGNTRIPYEWVRKIKDKHSKLFVYE